MAEEHPRDPAAARFWMLQLMRIGGAAMLAVGVMILAGRIDLPEAAGYGLVAFGLFEFFWLPVLLARRWKTPDA